MSTILVTGGAGFIGSHLVDALIAKKHKVIVVDDLSVGNRKNVHVKAHFNKIDITTSQLQSVFRKYRIDYIYHLAAQKNLQVSKKQPVHDANVNVLGSVRLFDLAKQHNIKKIIFYSTAAVYDPEARPPNKESDHPVPVTPYGIAKYATELYLKSSGLPYTILRLSNVYGPRQDAFGEGGAIAIFSLKLAKRKPVIVYNTGRQTRDFIYVDDVVNASLRAMQKAKNELLNISTAKETSVNTVIKTLSNIAQVDPVIKKKKIDEQYRSALANARAKRKLNWKPATALPKGLSLTYTWFTNEYASKKKK